MDELHGLQPLRAKGRGIEMEADGRGIDELKRVGRDTIDQQIGGVNRIGCDGMGKIKLIVGLRIADDLAWSGCGSDDRQRELRQRSKGVEPLSRARLACE